MPDAQMGHVCLSQIVCWSAIQGDHLKSDLLFQSGEFLYLLICTYIILYSLAPDSTRINT